MTQISKKILGRKLENEIHETFWAVIAKLTKKDEVSLFFNDLFTRNERVNFAKRLAILVLLHKDYDWRAIRDLIKVSEGTIAKISSRKNNEGFRLFYEKLEMDEEWKKFWHDLAKTYLLLTHPNRLSNLDDEGFDRLILKREKKTLL